MDRVRKRLRRGTGVLLSTICHSCGEKAEVELKHGHGYVQHSSIAFCSCGAWLGRVRAKPKKKGRP